MRVAIVASHAEVDADNTIHMRLSVDMDDGRTPSGWPGRCCAFTAAVLCSDRLIVTRS